MSWTEDRVTLLKKLWADSLSASQIAAEMGGFEGSMDGGRNAVIGKLHRLGLSLSYAHTSIALGRPTADGTMPVPVRVVRPHAPRAKVQRAKRQKRPGRMDIVRELAPVVMLEPGVPPPRSVFACQLLELNENTCRWPNGDPQDRENFHFCGAKPLPELPYCAAHAARAYRTPEQARAERALFRQEN